jgi:hypothetical protein
MSKFRKKKSEQKARSCVCGSKASFCTPQKGVLARSKSEVLCGSKGCFCKLRKRVFMRSKSVFLHASKSVFWHGLKNVFLCCSKGVLALLHKSHIYSLYIFKYLIHKNIILQLHSILSSLSFSPPLPQQQSSCTQPSSLVRTSSLAARG